MDHGAVTDFARSWGLLLLFVIFVGAVVWAYWPGNRRHLDKGSRAPLAEGRSLEQDIRDESAARDRGAPPGDGSAHAGTARKADGSERDQGARRDDEAGR